MLFMFFSIIFNKKYNVKLVIKAALTLIEKYVISKLKKNGQVKNKAFKTPEVSPSNSKKSKLFSKLLFDI